MIETVSEVTAANLITKKLNAFILGDTICQISQMKLVSNPAIGDVYTIKQKKNGESLYYFLKIIETNGDSIIAFHNNLDYGDFVNQ